MGDSVKRILDPEAGERDSVNELVRNELLTLR